MNKLIIDKATDKEKRLIKEKMSSLLNELDEKDKKIIDYEEDDIDIVRDLASDFLLVRVCRGVPNGREGWHNEVYMLYHDGHAELEIVEQDAWGDIWGAERGELDSLPRKKAALFLCPGNKLYWESNEERAERKSCFYL